MEEVLFLQNHLILALDLPYFQFFYYQLIKAYFMSLISVLSCEKLLLIFNFFVLRGYLGCVTYAIKKISYLGRSGIFPKPFDFGIWLTVFSSFFMIS